MYFRQTDQDLRDDVLQYELGNATSDIRIWDLSDPLNMVEIPTTFSTNTLFFVPSVRSDLLVREFLAIRTSATFPKPEVIGKIANQNLHAIQQADYVIISPNEFREQAMRLATFHQQKNGYSVVIVEPQQIYNEFSSGTPDATAYRWFLKMLYDRAGDNINNQPKALLFVGMSSYDNRGIVHSKLPLLSYQSDNSIVSTSSYTTDDYYAFLDDSEGLNVSRDVMDIGVGRLPVATLSEAKIVVDKIVNYTNNTKKGLWKNYAGFFSIFLGFPPAGAVSADAAWDISESSSFRGAPCVGSLGSVSKPEFLHLPFPHSQSQPECISFTSASVRSKGRSSARRSGLLGSNSWICVD